MVMELCSLFVMSDSSFVRMFKMSTVLSCLRFFGVLALITFLIGTSCRKNELDPTPVELGYEYFPNTVGMEWTYRVDSIVFDGYAVDSGKIDTITYWVKHIVDANIFDGSGDSAQKISRYIKTAPNKPFLFNRNFSMRITKFRAEVNDTAGRIIKLVFPASLHQYWDANAFNSRQSEEYQIVDKKNTEVIGGSQYDNTLHVLQRDVEYFIQKRYGIEKYAKHIGMVYKSDIKWDLTIKDNVSKKDGYDCTYTLVEFKR